MCLRVAPDILGEVTSNDRAGPAATTSANWPGSATCSSRLPFPDDPMTTEDRTPFRPLLSTFLGIVAPLLCIAIQFTIFPELIDDLPGLSFLNTYPLLNYGIVALEILTLATWLSLGGRVGRGGGVIAGLLLAGSGFSGLLGVVLLPFSLIGLVALIGVLGLVPL